MATLREPMPSPALRGRWNLSLVALFVLAAAWRLAYLSRLGATAFAGSLNADARIYWEWSESLLQGGLLPSSPFYLAPLFPYVIAGLRAAGADGPARILIVQALLGSLAVVLLADAARRLAGRPAALVVGGALAFLQTATFFDGLLLPESLLFFLESLLVWYVASTDWSRATFARYGVCGFLVGILALGRGSGAVLLPLVLFLAWRRPGAVARLRAAGASAGAFALCILPSLAANHHASGEWIPLTYNVGYNLYVGNNPDADGGYVDIVGGSSPVPLPGTSPAAGGALDGRAFVLSTEGLRLSPAESSRYWGEKAAAFVRENPGRALDLAARKLLLAWNHRRVPQIESMDSYARAAGPLGLPVLGSTGLLAVLGLAGLVPAARRGAAGRWLAGYAVVVSLAMAPFFVTDRYRHHLTPALAVLAAVALAEAGAAWSRRSRSALTAPALSAAAGVLLLSLPVGIPGSDWSFQADRAIRLLDRGAYEEATEAFARAEGRVAGLPPQELSESNRVHLAAFHLRYGIALEALDRTDEAIFQWERAATLNPRDAESLNRLVLAYEQAGRVEDADRMRRELALVPGGRGRLLLDEAWSAAGRGDLAGAERRFLDALDASPDLPLAWEGLIRVLIQTGRLREAAGILERARGAGLDPFSAEVYTAYLAAETGDPEGLRRALARIPDEGSPGDPTLARLLAHARDASVTGSH